MTTGTGARRGSLARLRPGLRPWLRRCRRGDEGAVSLFVALCAGGLVVVIALVIDVGGRLRVAERTDACAQEAARVGGQQLDQAAVLQGRGVKVQQEYVRQAADAYLTVCGGLRAGDIAFSDDGRVVTVTVQAPFQPVLLAGLGKRMVTGKGSATLVHGVEKAETD